MARSTAAVDVKATRHAKRLRQREDGHQVASAPATVLTQMKGNSHLLVLKELRQQRQAMKVAAAFGNSSMLAKWVRDLKDEQFELEGYCQMLRAVMALNRHKKLGRERHLAAIPESDDEEEYLDVLSASFEVSVGG
ncbi:g8696 [Coccomyxa viridis]|uniref:G8696 protein n=1 Tax=Coccomyxa viridis TaxID=1274662 RepID=A0ABP1G104_9CHLO